MNLTSSSFHENSDLSPEQAELHRPTYQGTFVEMAMKQGRSFLPGSFKNQKKKEKSIINKYTIFIALNKFFKVRMF